MRQQKTYGIIPPMRKPDETPTETPTPQPPDTRNPAAVALSARRMVAMTPAHRRRVAIAAATARWAKRKLG